MSQRSSHTRPVPIYRDCQATRANAEAKACQRVCLSQRMADRNEVAN